MFGPKTRRFLWDVLADKDMVVWWWNVLDILYSSAKEYHGIPISGITVFVF